MGDPSQRRAWTEDADEEAPPESWLTLDDDELLHRVETLAEGENEDERLLEVVASNRHFFIRQEAAKRVRDRDRLFAFEDDRHVGQILVRHLTRREDVTYLERLCSRSQHVEVRVAAQVQLARLWRRLDAPKAPAPVPPPPEPPAPSPAEARPAPPASPAAPAPPVTSEALASDGVDGSLLGWAAHFVVEQVWSHLGTTATRELLLRTRRDLLGRHPTLVVFDVTEHARVTASLGAGVRLPREAVDAAAAWLTALREAAREVAPDIEKTSVRTVTTLVADALSEAGFYTACDEFEARLRR
jgi:hypothetical protein